MNDHNSRSEKIKCLECGKEFDFLSPHINKFHAMTINEYRERWKIPRHVALASRSHRRRCQERMLTRIKNKELCPADQIEMMQKAYHKSTSKRVTSSLARERASETARNKQIWKHSPAIKFVSAELKQEAIARMKARPFTKEPVKDIAAALNLSVSRLYAWVKQQA
ncbi:TPA: MucR family transcriptional regulator [Yersinia enterocolitica]|nr:MucR family transcriptional regulator [Yersinia enterocolitica]